MEQEGGLPWNTQRTSTNPPFERSSKRRKGFPSETHVKAGLRFVHGEKDLLEKLGRNDLCPCGSNRRFQKLLPANRQLRRRAQKPLLSGIRTTKGRPPPPFVGAFGDPTNLSRTPAPARLRHLDSLVLFRPTDRRAAHRTQADLWRRIRLMKHLRCFRYVFVDPAAFLANKPFHRPPNRLRRGHITHQPTIAFARNDLEASENRAL